jgi:hypothetical protein
MSAFNRYAAILGFALVSAQASAVDVSFTSGTLSSTASGNTYTATDTLSGLTLTATAWSNANKAGNFQVATLAMAKDGLGACTSNCKSDSTLNNTINRTSASGDLILVTFSQAVNLQSLSLQQSGKDSDLSLWAGTGAFSPAGLKASQLGTATPYINTNSVAGSRTVSLTTFTGSYDWLAIATSVANLDKTDYAKLKSLTVNPVAQPVPDPTTWMTMLAGLGLVGFRVSRRTQT